MRIFTGGKNLEYNNSILWICFNKIGKKYRDHGFLAESHIRHFSWKRLLRKVHCLHPQCDADCCASSEDDESIDLGNKVETKNNSLDEIFLSEKRNTNNRFVKVEVIIANHFQSSISLSPPDHYDVMHPVTDSVVPKEFRVVSIM